MMRENPMRTVDRFMARRGLFLVAALFLLSESLAWPGELLVRGVGRACSYQSAAWRLCLALVSPWWAFSRLPARFAWRHFPICCRLI